MEQAKHWSDDVILNSRAFFKYNEEPSKLTLDGVRDNDSGVYRCRVDFKNSPSRNQRVNLTVILPPEKLSVLNEQGVHISHYILGPYNEGSSIDIICVATGGRPSPRVTWWQENALLDDTYENLSEKRVRNILHLENLQRKHLNTVYTCQASNNNLIAPISSAITLNLNLRPLSVRLDGDNRPMSADSTYELHCNVIGARPNPVITWWKGSIEMKNTREITSYDSNVTTSILTLVPTVEDHGKYLSCRAVQPLIPDSGIEDGWKLNIHHTPIVYLQLGSNLNSSVIREGDDVYFECNIRSNPWVYKVSWRHNGKILYNNAAIGTIVSNQSLVLQNVNRSRGGLYTCIGSNQEGDGESNAVQLDIKFKPICRPGQNRVYGVGKHETVKIPCDVEANPTSVKFTWKFNTSSSDVSDVPRSTVIVDQTRSVAAYIPEKESDYGSLLCWATNEIGVQIEPCVFYISPAGKPDSLSNCTILNQTAKSIQIECIEGYDGGLAQQFLIEIFDSPSGNLVFNMTSKFPIFNIDGLKSGLGFHVELFSINKKGRSVPVKLQAYTLKSAEKHIASLPVLIEITPIFGIIIGITSTITFCIFMTTVIVKCHRCRKHKNSKDFDETGIGPNDRNHCMALDANDKASSEPLNKANDKDKETNDSVETNFDDKNPDIIPHNSLDGDFLNESMTPFERLNNIFPRSYQKIASPKNLLNNPYDLYSAQFPNDMAYAELSLINQNHPHVIFKQQPLSMPTINAQESILYTQIDLSKKISPCVQSHSPHIYTMNNTLRRNQNLQPSYLLRPEAQCLTKDIDNSFIDNVNTRHSNETCTSSISSQRTSPSTVFLVNNNQNIISATSSTRF